MQMGYFIDTIPEVDNPTTIPESKKWDFSPSRAGETGVPAGTAHAVRSLDPPPGPNLGRDEFPGDDWVKKCGRTIAMI